MPSAAPAILRRKGCVRRRSQSQAGRRWRPSSRPPFCRKAPWHVPAALPVLHLRTYWLPLVSLSIRLRRQRIGGETLALDGCAAITERAGVAHKIVREVELGAGDFLQGVHELGRQLHLERADVVVELFHGPRSDDG